MILMKQADQELGLAILDTKFVEPRLDWKSRRKKINDHLEHSQIKCQEDRCVPFS